MQEKKSSKKKRKAEAAQANQVIADLFLLSKPSARVLHMCNSVLSHSLYVMTRILWFRMTKRLQQQLRLLSLTTFRSVAASLPVILLLFVCSWHNHSI